MSCAVTLLFPRLPPISATCMRMPFVSTVRCFALFIGVSTLDGNLRLAHHREHALHELGVLVDTARLEQMLNLGSELMYGRVTGGQLGEGNAELERLFEVGGPLATSIWVNEIWNGGPRPRCDDQRGDFGEEGRRQAGQRIRVAGLGLQQSGENSRLLCRDTHPLTVHGIEAADRVPKR